MTRLTAKHSSGLNHIENHDSLPGTEKNSPNLTSPKEMKNQAVEVKILELEKAMVDSADKDKDRIHQLIMKTKENEEREKQKQHELQMKTVAQRDEERKCEMEMNLRKMETEEKDKDRQHELELKMLEDKEKERQNQLMMNAKAFEDREREREDREKEREDREKQRLHELAMKEKEIEGARCVLAGSYLGAVRAKASLMKPQRHIEYAVRRGAFFGLLPDYKIPVLQTTKMVNSDELPAEMANLDERWTQIERCLVIPEKKIDHQ